MSVEGSRWYPIWRVRTGVLAFAGWLWARGNDVRVLGSQLMSCDVAAGRHANTYIISDLLGWAMHPVYGSRTKGPVEPIVSPTWFQISYNPTPPIGWLYTSLLEARTLNGFMLSCNGPANSWFSITTQQGTPLL